MAKTGHGTSYKAAIGLAGAMAIAAAGVVGGPWIAVLLAAGSAATLGAAVLIRRRECASPAASLAPGASALPAASILSAVALKVEVESYATGTSREYVLVVTNVGERCRVRAQAELLYGCEREVDGLDLRRYYLPWEDSGVGGLPESRILGHSETGSLQVARWTIQGGRDLSQLYFIMGGGRGTVDTNLGMLETTRAIYLQVTFHADRDLPGFPATQRYRFDWDGLREDLPLA